MKLLAPLPLFGVAVLTAGVIWFALRSSDRDPPDPERGPPSLVVDKSVHERLLAAAADSDRGRRSARFATGERGHAGA